MRVPLVLGAVLALAAMAGCSGGGGTPTGAPTPPAAQAITCNATGNGSAVEIVNFAFSPATVGVSANGFLVFTNNDGTNHTVTFDNGPDCGVVNSGGGVQTIQFTAAGTFAFHCRIHPSMKGTITVS